MSVNMYCIVDEHRNNLNALQGESGNDLMLYGRDVPKVKQMIEKSKKQFKQEPRGPLGSYIKLKDKNWAVAIEGFIGPGTLGAFTVDNKHDCDLLRQIFNKVWTSGVQPQVITSKFIFKVSNMILNYRYYTKNGNSKSNLGTSLSLNQPNSGILYPDFPIENLNLI